MPVQNCPACGFDIPEGEQICPNCGFSPEGSAVEENYSEVPGDNDVPGGDEIPDGEEPPDGEKTESEDDSSDDMLQRGCLIAVGIVGAIVLIVMMIMTFYLGSNR